MASVSGWVKTANKLESWAASAERAMADLGAKGFNERQKINQSGRSSWFITILF